MFNVLFLCVVRTERPAERLARSRGTDVRVIPSGWNIRSARKSPYQLPLARRMIMLRR